MRCQRNLPDEAALPLHRGAKERGHPDECSVQVLFDLCAECPGYRRVPVDIPNEERPDTPAFHHLLQPGGRESLAHQLSRAEGTIRLHFEHPVFEHKDGRPFEVNDAVHLVQDHLEHLLGVQRRGSAGRDLEHERQLTGALLHTPLEHLLV